MGLLPSPCVGISGSGRTEYGSTPAKAAPFGRYSLARRAKSA